MSESRVIQTSSVVIRLSVIGLTMLSILAIFVWAYVMTFFRNYYRGSYIIGDTGASSEDVEDVYRPFIEVNIFTNQNNNGLHFSEIKFNYFDGLRVQEGMERSSGLQWASRTHAMPIYDQSWWRSVRGRSWGFSVSSWNPNEDTINRRQSQIGLRAVTMADDDSHDHRFSRAETRMTVPIEDTPYQINVDGSWRTSTTVLGTGQERINYYNWDMVFMNIIGRVRNSVTTDGTYQFFGTRTRRLSLWDLFSVRRIGNDGQVHTDRVDRTDVFSSARVTINPNGFRANRESLFGLLGGCGEFDLLDDGKYNTDFAVLRQHVTLTAQNFDIRFSHAHGGYVLSLSSRVRQQLLDMRRFYLFVNLSRSNSVVGIDFNGLRGLEIATMRITGTGNFYFLDYAFRDSTVESWEVANSINLQGVNYVI
ncbi:MAG: hypothetical protein FWE01_00765 [Firmicutes bacterium]|nr:hypothetical protein [Bacillota bacterium]